jgi:diaminopimelate epimerase
VETGKAIRYSADYQKEGINVNLVEVKGDNNISMLTYERGVEDETLSCGTGATAAALAYAFQNNKIGQQVVAVQVKGGDLKVKFLALENGHFENIQLIGPAVHVFDGKIELNINHV